MCVAACERLWRQGSWQTLSSEMSNSATNPEVLNEILTTLQQLIRSHQVESASKSNSDEPGPSSSVEVQRSSSCERALAFMREIRTGTRAAIEGEQRHNLGPYTDKGKRRKRSSVSAVVSRRQPLFLFASYRKREKGLVPNATFSVADVHRKLGHLSKINCFEVYRSKWWSVIRRVGMMYVFIQKAFSGKLDV